MSNKINIACSVVDHDITRSFQVYDADSFNGFGTEMSVYAFNKLTTTRDGVTLQAFGNKLGCIFFTIPEAKKLTTHFDDNGDYLVIKIRQEDKPVEEVKNLPTHKFKPATA